MLDLYKNIKIRRNELGISQQQLAEMVGYKGKSMIAQIEKGGVDLSSTMITRFAQALKTTESALMGWEEKAEPSIENAAILADLMHDTRLLEQVKKIITFDEKKKETLYNYIDFLFSN